MEVFMFNDILLVRHDNDTVSALVTDTNGEQRWINGGSFNQGTVTVPQLSLSFELAGDAVRKYLRSKADGDENAHHVVVGKGETDEQKFIGFFDRDGVRIGLKPASGGTTKSFADF
jgi:hypothetical protein